jgi:hypothetical protein
MEDLSLEIQRPILPEPPGKINATKPAKPPRHGGIWKPIGYWILLICDWLYQRQSFIHSQFIHDPIFQESGDPMGPASDSRSAADL